MRTWGSRDTRMSAFACARVSDGRRRVMRVCPQTSEGPVQHVVHLKHFLPCGSRESDPCSAAVKPQCCIKVQRYNENRRKHVIDVDSEGAHASAPVRHAAG